MHCNPARLDASRSSASDIYRDILALDEEFEEVDIDLDEHELSVTTDRIVLEDVHLGAFQIRLDWRQLGDLVRRIASWPSIRNPAARVTTSPIPMSRTSTLRGRRPRRDPGRAG